MLFLLFIIEFCNVTVPLLVLIIAIVSVPILKYLILLMDLLSSRIWFIWLFFYSQLANTELRSFLKGSWIHWLAIWWLWNALVQLVSIYYVTHFKRFQFVFFIKYADTLFEINKRIEFILKLFWQVFWGQSWAGLALRIWQ